MEKPLTLGYFNRLSNNLGQESPFYAKIRGREDTLELSASTESFCSKGNSLIQLQLQLQHVIIQLYIFADF